jgi:hypothetical protein
LTTLDAPAATFNPATNLFELFVRGTDNKMYRGTGSL